MAKTRTELTKMLKQCLKEYEQFFLNMGKEEVFKEATIKCQGWDKIKELIEDGIYTEEEMYKKAIPILIKIEVESML